MKKNNWVIYLSWLFLLIYIVIFKTIIGSSWVYYIDWFNILFFLALGIMGYVFLGFPRRKNLISYEGVQTIVIGFIIYYVGTYLMGLFLGFLSNSYSLKWVNILENIGTVMAFYGLRELYRYMIVRKAKEKDYLLFVVVTILLAVLDIVMEINAYDLRTGSGIFEFIEASVVPNLALNSLLSYISYKFDFRLVMLFLVGYSLPQYFLPILPNMGLYVGSMVKLVFLFGCYYQLSLLVERYERRLVRKKRKERQWDVLLILLGLLVLVGLVSGIFKYHLLAIGSNSMIPYFSRGDVVLIEKLGKEERENLKVGEVLAFYHSGQILVHRIIEITWDNDGNCIIKTKGDNNDLVDSWIVSDDDIYGRVRYVIKYIGLPSVELGEYMDETR